MEQLKEDNKMNTQLFNFIDANFIKTIIIVILVAIIKEARPYVFEFIDQAKTYIAIKIAASQYSEQYLFALNVWYRVEEDFKVDEKVVEYFQSKAEYFDKLLLEKFPELTQYDLDTLRQAISGQENLNK
jgi:hypothetical protein